MRNFLFILISCFYFLSSSFSQPVGWNWQNPSPTGNLLKDVQFVDSQNVFSVGEVGTILNSTNGGSIWNSQISGTRNHLNAVHFIEFQKGWAVGFKGTILKTSNNGQLWQELNSGTIENLNSVQFINEQNGWAVGDAGIILKTENGGQSWQTQNSGTLQTLSSVSFLNDQMGWIAGYNGTVLKTSNGGQTWESQTSGTNQWLNSIQFVNAQKGFAVGWYTLLKTSDGGESWTNQYLSSQKFNSLQFIDSLRGWAVAGDTIFKTTNSGQSWSKISTETQKIWLGIHFTNSSIGLAVGLYGSIIKSIDSGNSWQTQITSPTQNLNSVYFSDKFNGWAVGSGGTILNTNNGGKIWKKQTSGTAFELNSVQFCDPFNGWSVGVQGKILKTSNSGTTWSIQNTSAPGSLFSVFFVDPQIGWTVGAQGAILKSTNGGLTWQNQISGTTRELRSVFFADYQNGWVVGMQGTILRTTNGGNNWFPTLGWPTHFTSVFFLNPLNGWLSGYSGKILKTSDGGITWQEKGYNTSTQLNSIVFLDPQNGFAVGGDGMILKTINGGDTWKNLYFGSSPIFNSVHFKDPFHGWIVGKFGSIISIESSDIISPENLTSKISGNLFQKTNSNCNPSNIPVPNRLVKAMPGPYYGMSDNQGKYNIRLPLADTATSFTLKGLENSNPAFNFEVVCPINNQHIVTLDTIPDTLSGKDFGFEITPCHHLDVQLASNLRRRCFKNTTSISYQNQGSLSAPGAYILVEFPKWVRPISASRSYVAINDSVWRFNLDTVSAGESGSFTITDSVLCGNLDILGLSQCTKATIFPAPNCPSSNWNGASLSASGICSGSGIVRLTLKNDGTGDMLDSTTNGIYLDSILVSQKRLKLAQNDSIVFQVQANGKTVRLQVDQPSNHPTQNSITLNVEGCGQSNQNISKGFVNKFPLAQSPNSKTHCLPIIGAYDPNDKMVVPQGFTNQNIIPLNTRSEYLVRFQNTGNDTAFTVFVIDTLDQNLNPETFEMGAVSHNYQLSMQTVKSGKTFLRWQFNNIQLPDSSTNQLKSNGFIQYRISPKPNLALGTKVRNHAEIYFDFNPPIITNQTLSTYDIITYRDPALNGTVQIVTGLPGKLSPKQIGVNLYPNPVTEHSLTADFQAKGSLILFNAQGQLVYEQANIEGKQVLPIRLKTGFYMAQLKTEKGVSVVKVVVEQ